MPEIVGDYFLHDKDKEKNLQAFRYIMKEEEELYWKKKILIWSIESQKMIE